jgi:hypothetical protein
MSKNLLNKLFSEEKKKKKESRRISGGFKRSQVFLKKYYPIHHRKCGREIGIESCCETVWVEIFSKTRRA